MKSATLISLIGIFALHGIPLLAQQRNDPVEVAVEAIQATPYGVNVTLKALRLDEELNIMIGLTEGEAIARVLRHQPPQRPMTHDLIKMILDQTGWQVQEVLIRGIRGTTYLADLVLERDGETKIIDARPSDAMAIAVRFDAKIFVAPKVFEGQRRLEQPEPGEEPKQETSPSPEGGVHL